MLYILDASAILNNPFFGFSEKEDYACTSDILREIKSREARAFAENLIKSRRLRICDPHKKFLDEARAFAEKKGFGRIGKADLSVIALAMELKERKPVVLTDDYSVQNLLALKEIDFQPLIQGKIKRKIIFLTECPECKKKFFSGEKCCDCGLLLKKCRKRI